MNQSQPVGKPENWVFQDCSFIHGPWDAERTVYALEGRLEQWANDGLGAELTLGDVPYPGSAIEQAQGKRVRVTIEVLPD